MAVSGRVTGKEATSPGATATTESGAGRRNGVCRRKATRTAADPELALARRLEVGRQSGVPEAALARYAERAKQAPSGIAETQLGTHPITPVPVIAVGEGLQHVGGRGYGSIRLDVEQEASWRTLHSA